MKTNKKLIQDAFKKTDLSLEFGKDWLNIMRPDGVHCEFYHDGELNGLFATYTLNNKEQDLYYSMNDLNNFVTDIKEILK